ERVVAAILRGHGEVERHAGDVELGEVVASEGDAGGAGHRHLDHGVEFTAGRVPAHLARAPDSDPDEAVGVDGHAVGDGHRRRARGVVGDIDHASPARDGPGGAVEVEGVDASGGTVPHTAAGEAVDEEHRRAVITPVEPV